jgi:hypothetical protein
MAYTTIDDGSVYFQTLLYTGNGSSSRALTNTGNSDLQPDWIWIKNRGNATTHGIWDSSRGAGKRLTIAVDAEEDQTNLASFNSDGFTVNTGDIVNTNTHTYVAWQWKANAGTTASNSNGGVTSTVQANTAAGFSIVQWAGDGSDETVGHGLSSAPQMYVVKNRADSTDWRVGQTVAGNIMTGGNGYYMEWNHDKASTNPGSATTWGSTPTAPTSTVFTVGSNNAHNGSGDDFVAYCFHSVQGYSKISSYTGNADTDGPFVYTGFKPAWIIIKRTDSANSWYLIDSTRGSTNVISAELESNNNGVEATSNVRLDILSNGFKIRTSGAAYNASSGTYLYMAFAEHPFVSSKGVPTTAR